MINKDQKISLMGHVAKERYGKVVSELMVNEAVECGRVVREAIRIYRDKVASGQAGFIH